MRTVFFFIICLALPWCLGAAPPLEFNQVWQRIQSQHPSLVAAQAQLEASQAQAQQAERWLPANPELQMQYGNQFIQGNPQDDQWQIQLSQTFEVAGQMGLRVSQSQHLIETQRMAQAEQRRQLKHQLWHIWLELGGLQALYQAQSQTLKVLKTLDSASEQRYLAGDISFLERDILRLNLQQEQQIQTQRQWEITYQQQQLANLLQEDWQPYQVAFQLRRLKGNWTLESLETSALGLRPDYLGLQQRVAQAEFQTALAEKLQIPDLRIFLGLSGSRGQLRPEDFIDNPGDIKGIIDNNHTLQLGVSSPLPVLSRRPEVAQARAEAQRYQALIKTKAQNIRLEIRNALTQYQMVQKMLETDTRLSQQLAHQMALLSEAYQRGEVTLERLLYSQEKWLRFQETFWQHQIQAQKSLVDLEIAVGQPLTGDPHAL